MSRYPQDASYLPKSFCLSLHVFGAHSSWWKTCSVCGIKQRCKLSYRSNGSEIKQTWLASNGWRVAIWSLARQLLATREYHRCQKIRIKIKLIRLDLYLCQPIASFVVVQSCCRYDNCLWFICKLAARDRRRDTESKESCSRIDSLLSNRELSFAIVKWKWEDLEQVNSTNIFSYTNYNSKQTVVGIFCVCALPPARCHKCKSFWCLFGNLSVPKRTLPTGSCWPSEIRMARRLASLSRKPWPIR